MLFWYKKKREEENSDVKHAQLKINKKALKNQQNMVRYPNVW